MEKESKREQQDIPAMYTTQINLETCNVPAMNVAVVCCAHFVNTTPQMTCFRDAKVCTKWLQGKVMMN